MDNTDLPMICPHFKLSEKRGYGLCAIGKFNGTPSRRECIHHCDNNTGGWRDQMQAWFSQIRARKALPPLVRLTPESQRSGNCLHRGDETGDVTSCATCSGHVLLKTFHCAKHGVCTVGRPVPDMACCARCGDNTNGATN